MNRKATCSRLVGSIFQREQFFEIKNLKLFYHASEILVFRLIKFSAYVDRKTERLQVKFDSTGAFYARFIEPKQNTKSLKHVDKQRIHPLITCLKLWIMQFFQALRMKNNF